MSELDIEKIKKSKFNVSVETLITIVAVVVTVVGMWYSLQADIQLAKELPEPPVSRTEYDLKDQLIRETIINTQEKVEENGKKLEDIDNKLYEIIFPLYLTFIRNPLPSRIIFSFAIHDSFVLVS